MDICRICLNKNIKKDLSDLPKHLHVQKSFQEIILFCLNIEVYSKIYTKLCNKCFKLLVSFYSFKVEALETDKYIQSLCQSLPHDFNEGNIKIEDEEYTEYEVLQTNDDHTFSEDIPDVGSIDFRKDEKIVLLYTDDITVDEDGLCQSSLQDLGEFDTRNTVSPIKTKTEATKLQKQKHKKRITTQHICEMCGIQVDDLIKHNEMHKKSDALATCSECNQQFLKKKYLAIHFTRKHGIKMERYPCGVCDRSVSCLRGHMLRIHKEKIKRAECKHCTPVARECHACQLCPQTFKVKRTLARHVRLKHGQYDAFSCKFCPKTFCRYHALQTHIDSHNPHENVIDTKAVKKEVETEAGEPKGFECDKCHQVLTSKESLDWHTRERHAPGAGAEATDKRQCDVCCKYFSDVRAHKLTTHAETRRFACAHCGQGFVQQLAYETHLLKHSDVRPFKCPQCPASFTARSVLSDHVKSIHEKVKNFICQICSKEFYKKYHLEAHMVSHSSERAFACGECGRRFKSKASLRLHRPLHSDERPFHCQFCSHTFKKKSLLASHLRTHSSEQPFKCRFCDKRYKRQDYRRSHEEKQHLPTKKALDIAK